VKDIAMVDVVGSSLYVVCGSKADGEPRVYEVGNTNAIIGEVLEDKR
jgi:hypothetical protein